MCDLTERLTSGCQPFLISVVDQFGGKLFVGLECVELCLESGRVERPNERIHRCFVATCGHGDEFFIAIRLVLKDQQYLFLLLDRPVDLGLFGQCLVDRRSVLIAG